MRNKLTGMLAGFALTLASGTSVFAQDKELTIFWAEWDPANYLQELVNIYEAETGVKVTVETTPWSDFQTKAFTEFNAKGSAYDMVVGDSQWIGAASEAGHYVDMTEFFNKHDLTKVMAPATVKYYAEYPAASGKYWSIPAEGDAVGWSYRKDWFEDPKEMEAFKAKYGRGLAVPQTYQEARDVAEFFTRPDQGIYGWAQMGGRDYDFATTASNSFLWSFGGELYNPETMEVKGYLDSPASVDGVQAYVDMFQFGPPGSTNWGFDEVNTSIQQGQVAMAMQWFYFNGSNADPKVSKFADKVGFAVLPGAVGRDGKFRRQFSVGGQGMGINKYSKKLPELTKFMEWYFQPEQQKRYAAVCQTGLKTVLESPDWQELNSYNRQFSTALQYLNDYWHLPEYPVLLDELQQEISSAAAGTKTVQQALSDAAAKNERTLERAGYEIKRGDAAPEVPDQVISPVGVDAVVPVE